MIPARRVLDSSLKWSLDQISDISSHNPINAKTNAQSACPALHRIEAKKANRLRPVAAIKPLRQGSFKKRSVFNYSLRNIPVVSALKDNKTRTAVLALTRQTLVRVEACLRTKLNQIDTLNYDCRIRPQAGSYT